MLGSSRAQTLDASHLAGVAPDRWYNWWVPDLSAPELTALAERAVARGAAHVVIVIDPEVFLVDREGPAHGGTAGRLHEALADAPFPREFLDPWRQETLRDAWRLIAGAAPRPPADMHENGTRPPTAILDVDQTMGRIHKDGVIKLLGFYPRHETTVADPASMAWLNATLDIVQGTKTTIIMTPIHPAGRGIADSDPDFWALRDVIRNAIQDRCGDDWQVLDATRVEDIVAPGVDEPGPMGFRDGWHFGFETAVPILRESQRDEHACHRPAS